MIEAAKWGHLDQMLFFSAPLTTRALPTTVRRRPVECPAKRPVERPARRRRSQVLENSCYIFYHPFASTLLISLHLHPFCVFCCFPLFVLFAALPSIALLPACFRLFCFSNSLCRQSGLTYVFVNNQSKQKKTYDLAGQLQSRKPENPKIRPDVRPGVRPGVRPDVRPGVRPDVRPDGRRRRACRQRRRKKNHLIEAAPFGRLDQM